MTYHPRAIITRGLYTFYPFFEAHLCTVTFGLMYGYYSRAVSNQERVIGARARYMDSSQLFSLIWSEKRGITKLGKEGGGENCD